MDITNGTGVYATSGSALFAVSSAGPTYYLLGLTPSVSDSYGNYTYTRDSGTMGTIIANDITFGLSSTDKLFFTSATSGSFTVSSIGGTQSGTFKIVAAPTGIAPLTVFDKKATFQITAGHGDLASAGSYTVRTAAAGNGYSLTGSPGVLGSSGTYTYTKTTAATAVLSAIDSVSGALTEELSFATATSGSFLVGNASTDSWQIGTFTIAPSSVPPIGSLDRLTPQAAIGWALDRDTPATSITIRLDIDGITFAAPSASLARPDLIPTYGSANHGFDVALPQLSPGKHLVQVFATDVSGTTVLIASRTVTSANTARGFVDILSTTRIAGWAYASATSNSPVQLRIDIDGIPGTPIAADTARSDLTFLPSTAHAFDLATPILSAGGHIISIYLIDPLTGNALLLANKLLTFP
jgi:hypothetical protein